MSATGIVIFVLGILSFPGINGGQTVFKKPEITSLHISSDIKYRFATTTVTSRVKNVDTTSREAVFDVTLPNEAFITNLTLEIDGKIILGEIKEKEAAKKQYEAAQQRGESAGYIGTRHRETNRFNLAVTVAPQDKISFNLTYQELLKRTRGHYEQVIYIDPGQPVPDLDITVSILESREITDLRVPPLRNDGMADIEDISTITVITAPTPKTAHVKFVPSIEFQTVQSANGMTGQFVVRYDVEREMDIGDVLVVNGYFVHFFAPEGFQPIPNDVLFILDTSGSMTGKKMRQLKDAMQSILRQMNEGDRMNIMAFSGSTSFWKTKMVDIMDEDTMEEAKAHIASLTAGGFTNIDLALTTGVTFLRDRVHTDGAIRSPVIVFLTDGEATNGVTDPDQILKNIQSVNEVNIPVFSLAFGKYADYNIVKKISIQNNGLGRKIYDASDAAMQIAGFYNEISVTLLNNITFQYLDAPVANVTKHEFSNYFNGSEMVISGRLEDLLFNNDLTMRILGDSVDGPSVILSGEMSNLVDLNLADNHTDMGDFEKITEKVWAYLTIKELLNKELAASDLEERSAYKRQILDLSLKYDFVTPLTSMVVTLPNENSEEEHAVIDDEKKPTWRPRSVPKAQASNAMQRHSQRSSIPVMAQSFMDTAGVLAPPSLNSFKAHFPARHSGFKIRKNVGGPLMNVPTSISKFGASQNKAIYTTQKGKRKVNKARRQRKKNKRRNKKKQAKAGFKYPLRVQFPNLSDPMCFTMYEDQLENSPGSYILYVDTNLDLKVEVKLEKTLVGKWTKQGSIKELHLISANLKYLLTNNTFASKSVSTNDSAPWEVVYSPADRGVPPTEIRVKFDAFDIILEPTGDGFITAVAERSTQHGALAGSGIISQIMSKHVEVLKMKKMTQKKNKKGKAKPAKEIALFDVDGSKFSAMKRRLGTPGQSQEKCWALKSRENQMLDMTTARVV